MNNDLANQIEELRQTLPTSAARSHEKLSDLENQIVDEFEELKRRVRNVAIRARNLQAEFYEEIVDLAGVLGVVPSSRLQDHSTPPLPEFSMPNIARQKPLPSEKFAGEVFGQVNGRAMQ